MDGKDKVMGLNSENVRNVQASLLSLQRDAITFAFDLEADSAFNISPAAFQVGKIHLNPAVTLIGRKLEWHGTVVQELIFEICLSTCMVCASKEGMKSVGLRRWRDGGQGHGEIIALTFSVSLLEIIEDGIHFEWLFPVRKKTSTRHAAFTSFVASTRKEVKSLTLEAWEDSKGKKSIHPSRIMGMF